jgi:hypothetical protein
MRKEDLSESLSAFSDRTREPTDEDLRSVLGNAYAPWALLLAGLPERIGPVEPVWGFTGARYGWGLRIRYKKRVIVYMTPQKNRFLVSFALGEKAVAAASVARLPAAVLSVIDAAPRYPEGRGVRFEVRNSRQVAALLKLARVKNEN